MTAPRLHRLIAAGLKGAAIDDALSGCDLFAGPNGSGKSTRLIAVQAGLWGCAGTPTDSRRPWLGERPAARVELVFRDGTGTKILRRDLSTAPRSGAKSVDTVTAQAQALVGDHVVRADLGDFVAETPAGRDRLLRQLCGAACWDAPRALEHLRGRLPTGEAERKAADTEIRLLLRSHSAAGEGGAWVGEALTWATARFTVTNAGQGDARSAVVIAEQAARALPAPPAGGFAAARERLAQLRSQRDVAVAAGAGRAAAVKAVAAHQAEGERLAARVGAAEGAVADGERGLRTAEAVPVPVLDEAALDAARATLERARVARDSAARRAETVRHEAEGSAHHAARVAGELGALDALAVGATGCCRGCALPDPLDLAGRIGAARVAAVAAREDADAHQDAARVAADTLRRRESAGLVAGTALRTAERHLEEAQRAAVARTVAIDTAAGALSRAQARHRLDEEALTAWHETPAPVVEGLVGQDPADELAALDASIKDADAESERCRKAADAEAAVQRAIAERDAAEARHAAVVAVGTGLRATQRALVLAATEPVRSAANSVLERVGVPWRVDFREGGEVWLGAAGWTAERPFGALSDAERAITALALAVAFVRLGQRWPALLLDGLERVDRDRLPAVLGALASLVRDGVLANVLVALVATDPAEVPVVDGVTVHWLGAVPVAAREAA